MEIDSLSLPDLVASKKTQGDKDWPMLRRLVEVSYAQGFQDPTPERLRSWLQELRTPMILLELVGRFPAEARRAASSRPAVRAALDGDLPGIETALAQEEARERAADQAYWRPLRQELERLRREP